MKVYFAHPCFNYKQKDFKEKFLLKLSAFLTQSHKNITIVDPFEHTPNVENNLDIKLRMAETIKNQCLRLLEKSDVIIALIDDNDTGVAFEAGYAHALNKPVILISTGSCIEANAMLIGSAVAMIDNILDEGKIKELLNVIESLCVKQKSYEE